MHALQARQSSLAARPLVPLRAASRVPRRAAAVAVAAYSPPSLRGATALDQLVAVSSVVPDTVLLGKTAASDAPTAATVSAAVLAGLAANPAAGVREFQVREKTLSRERSHPSFEQRRQRRQMKTLRPLAYAFAFAISGSTPRSVTSPAREHKKGTRRRRRRAQTQIRRSTSKVLLPMLTVNEACRSSSSSSSDLAA